MPAERNAACELGDPAEPGYVEVRAPCRPEDTERSCAPLSRDAAASAPVRPAARCAEDQQVEIDDARSPALARRRAPERALERAQLAEATARGSSWVSSAATALTKSGCATGPKGLEP